jgi:hypothetical protein
VAVALFLLLPSVSAAAPTDDEPKQGTPAAERQEPQAPEKQERAVPKEQEPPAPKKKKVSFHSPDDGWFDMSEFLDTSYGFVPILWPITEPATGFGGCAALAFIGKSSTDTRAGFDQPNITGVAGIGTDNGTWGAAAMDSRYWMDNQLQTLVEPFGASINLDFYGLGEDSLLKDHPLTYNLQPVGGIVRGKYRIHRSRTWAGLGYMWRFGLVGFAGEGIAWVDLDRFDRQRTVTTGGTGFRYELARKCKLHMGVDVAFGPDGAAVYLQFGSAWMRP